MIATRFVANRHRRAIAKYQRRAEVDARAGIMPSHDGSSIGPAGEQAGNRWAACPQYPPISVRAQADACSERARIDRHRIIRSCRDRPETWIGPMGRISAAPVELARAFAEFLVLTTRGKPVLLVNRLREA